MTSNFLLIFSDMCKKNIPSFDIGLKPAIIKCLEAYRDDELAERRKLQDKNGEKTGDAALTAGGDGVAPSNDQNDTQTSMEVRFTFIYIWLCYILFKFLTWVML